MPIDPAVTVADLVLERPSRARVFEQLGIDYCCGGKHTLAAACAEAGVVTEEAVGALAAEELVERPDAFDWTQAPIDALCDHIVEAHHGRMREELPRLSALLEKVERAHGLHELRATFEGLRTELEEHMDDEEARLFPACRAGGPLAPGLVEELEHEHAETGAALERLHALTHGYDEERALCNTHRATLAALHELELDVHEHVHEENNILFPRVLASSAA